METSRFELLLTALLSLLCLGRSSPTSKPNAASNDDYGWKIGNVYKYGFSACGSASSHFKHELTHITGRLSKADLYIQLLSSNEWSATIKNFREKDIKDEVELEKCPSLLSNERNFQETPFNREAYKINLRDGAVTHLNDTHNQTVDEFEGRVLKFLTRLLQLNLKTGHCEDPKSCQLPTEDTPNALYKTSETFLAEKRSEVCETQYKVSSLSNGNLKTTPSILPSLRENGRLFEVERTADYKKCLQKFTDTTRKSKADEIISSTFINHVVLKGDPKHYIVQSSVLTTKHEALKEKEGTIKEVAVYYLNLTSSSQSNYPANGLLFH